jgi:acetylornithine deacetylase/succinyl-diaminopimelate desuccinylase-like protein
MTTTVQPHVSRQKQIAWLQRFVRYPSEWSELMEEEPSVRSFISDCAGPLISELGLKPRYDPMGNLIVEIGRRGSGKHLLLSTYAMTHPGATMVNPFAGELIDRNGKQAIRGRGISEQKAGLVSALAAVHARNERGEIGGALTFVLTTAGETGRHKAIDCVVNNLDRRPEMAVLCVCSSRKVALGNKGRYDIHVKIKGKTSHSSVPWAGIDAIAGAAKLLQELASLDLNVKPHPELGGPTLTPTAIESFPKASHTVQGEVRLTFDLRLLPGVDPDLAYDHVAKAIKLPAPWEVQVVKGPIQYPAEVSRNSDLVRNILAGCSAAGLEQPSFYYSNAALDSGYFTANGCDATMWGPGEVSMAHTSEESVLVDDVSDLADAYLGMINSYLG